MAELTPLLMIVLLGSEDRTLTEFRELAHVFSQFAVCYYNAPCSALKGVPELIQSSLDDVIFFLLLVIEESVDS